MTTHTQVPTSRRKPAWFLACILLLAGKSIFAAIDLRNAVVEQLDNGLTVIMLEDRNLPVVSVQMLYRVGARNESTGQTGIAHFLEHMAFRSSENFPGTGLVSSIYARGGEWHGYTWTDQTTYFATVPAEHLDLLLRIEADRMARLDIPAASMEAERGAVLAEMHMYENSPTSMLIDALMFTSFIAHPYRNNTIGWESDIEALRHAEVVAFYRQHYHPANAVLAIVGDFDADSVVARIDELFGDFEKKKATPLPHTKEPLQTGKRRVQVAGPGMERQFMIGYRAPASSHADFPAFLVLQELLGSGSGISFLQNDWGTPVEDEDLLFGAARDMTTWYPPSAQDYIFVIGGTADAGTSEGTVEERVEGRVMKLRTDAPSTEALNKAIADVLDELVFDVQTTEDAAHQLAFFHGIDALDVLLQLPARVSAVAPKDIVRVANTWLRPEQRTIAWHVPRRQDTRPREASPATAKSVTESAPAPLDGTPMPTPRIRTLSGGLPVVIQQSDFSPTAHIKLITLATDASSGVGYRVLGFAELDADGLASDLGTMIDDLHARFASRDRTPVTSGELSLDPETRLEQEFRSRMWISPDGNGQRSDPVMIIVAGDVDENRAVSLLEASFGQLPPAKPVTFSRSQIDPGMTTVPLDVPLAQTQLGYLVAAPGPADGAADAWRLLLYILSHDYEGRLGIEAISNRGLAYYIDSRYRSDGQNAWITLATGVDPDKLDALAALLQSELRRLQTEPPTASEVDEAKAHWIGRKQSAAQSNAERAAMLAEDWLWYGDIQSGETLQRRLEAVSTADVREVVAEFIDGLTIVLRE